jgi:hypothetical protein
MTSVLLLVFAGCWLGLLFLLPGADGARGDTSKLTKLRVLGLQAMLIQLGSTELSQWSNVICDLAVRCGEHDLTYSYLCLLKYTKPARIGLCSCNFNAHSRVEFELILLVRQMTVLYAVKLRGPATCSDPAAPMFQPDVFQGSDTNRNSHAAHAPVQTQSSCQTGPGGTCRHCARWQSTRCTPCMYGAMACQTPRQHGWSTQLLSHHNCFSHVLKWHHRSVVNYSSRTTAVATASSRMPSHSCLPSFTICHGLICRIICIEHHQRQRGLFVAGIFYNATAKPLSTAMHLPSHISF